MRGHEPIIAMRKKGIRPSIIFIDDTPKLSVLSREWHNPGERYGEVWEPDFPAVDVLDTETVERLDLRFVMGCVVSISSGTERRAKRLLAACQRAGAKVVAATHAIEANGRIESGWTEIWRAENG